MSWGAPESMLCFDGLLWLQWQMADWKMAVTAWGRLEGDTEPQLQGAGEGHRRDRQCRILPGKCSEVEMGVPLEEMGCLRGRSAGIRAGV